MVGQEEMLVIDKGQVVAFAAPDSVGSLDKLMRTTAEPKGVA